jgi:hypothetical protein
LSPSEVIPEFLGCECMWALELVPTV